MARQRKPKILYVDAPETGAEDSRAKNKKEKKEKKLRKRSKNPVEDRRSTPKVVAVVPEVPAAETPPEIHEKKSASRASEPLAKEAEFVPPADGEAPVPASSGRGRRPNLVLSILFGGIFLTVMAAFIFIPLNEQENGTVVTKEYIPNCLGINPDIDWGYQLHELNCRSGVVREGEGLAEILLDKRVSYKSVIQLQDHVKRNGMPAIQPGNSFVLLYHDNDPLHPYMLAYSPDVSSYVLLNLKGEAAAEWYQLRIESTAYEQMEVAVVTDLAEAMFNREFGLSLAREMEDALKWKLDFFHLDPGDRFSLLYKGLTFEGGVKNIEKLAAVRYRHAGEEGYAFYYQDAYVNGFFDAEGRAMRSGFLKAPLEYIRISSSYSLKRRDPILNNGTIREHLGTDYAAPTGTPIFAVADGIVIKAEKKGGNGNYVKIFHSETIQTQYLHMRNFADGIAPGTEVRQGQVIGYVGSTGRATGPHVCFRFWKNGKQVDHRKEDFLGPSPPLRGKSMEQFQLRRDSLMSFFEPV